MSANTAAAITTGMVREGRKRRGRESCHRQEHNQHPKEIDPRFRISHAASPPCLVTQGWGRPGRMSPPIRGKPVLRRLGEANPLKLTIWIDIVNNFRQNGTIT